MKKKSYRTTMPFDGGLSPITDKVKKNQPWLGGGPRDKERRNFDSTMGGDHKFIGPDPDGMSHAVGGLFHGEWTESDPEVPYSTEIVVVDNQGGEHVYDKVNFDKVVMKWKGKPYKLIYRRQKGVSKPPPMSIPDPTSLETAASSNSLTKEAQSANIVPLVANIMPACFKVESESVRYGKMEIGSCFAVSDGKFVTCAHVISKRQESPSDVSIYLIEGDRRFKATVDDIDYEMDLAVLSCDTVKHTPLAMKSISDVPTGSEIVCVGSPFGYDNNISRGIISSKGRIIEEPGRITYFFIDLSVYPGNSGGPVIDVDDGSVIGVAAVIVDSVGNYGLNAAIPSDYVNKRFHNVLNNN